MEKFIGGLRIGNSYFDSLNFTYPFSSIEIQDDALFIKYPIGKCTVPFSSIKSIELYSGFYSKGLRIDHSVDQVPSFIVFWYMNNRQLIDRLRLSKLPVSLGTEQDPKSLKGGSGLSGWFFFIGRTTFLFIVLFLFEIAKSRDVPDALLNAFGFTAFITTAVSIFLATRNK